jgi:urease accessory protein
MAITTTARTASTTTASSRRGPAVVAEVSVVVRLIDGRSVVTRIAGAVPWRVRVLPTNGRWARIVLVQSCAGLLAGDRFTLTVDVEAGARLRIEELGATLVYPDRGAGPASSVARLTVGEEARLVWRAAPLIAACGCSARREVVVELEPGARLLLAESLALGRFGEPPGALQLASRVSLGGRPLLAETIDTGERELLGSAVVAGRARMIASALLAGERPADDEEGLELALPGTLWRGLGEPVEVEATLAGVVRRWAARIS